MRIQIIAPSSPFETAPVLLGVEILKSAGNDVLPVDLPLRDRSVSFLNGPDQDRLKELAGAFGDPQNDVVWLARGGYGLTRLLPNLELKKTKLPIFVGFSDGTALSCFLWQQYGQQSIHGPAVISLAKEPKEVQDALWHLLNGRSNQFSYPAMTAHQQQNKPIRGPLFAANLCVLTHLVGTAAMPNFSGGILILEDVGERPYRIDRMLTHLHQANALSGVKAVIGGHFTRCEENGSPTPLDVLQERMRAFQIPFFSGLPVGHDTPNWPIPFGAKSEIVPEGPNSRLVICEEIG